MRFLKELFGWLLHGRDAAEKSEPAATADSPTAPAPSKTIKPPKQEFDLFASPSQVDFLGELQSIRADFALLDTAKKQLIDELRRLDPKKRNKAANS